MNEYFNHSDPLVAGGVAKAVDVNSIAEGVAAGFDKLPTPERIKQGTSTLAVETAGSVANVYKVDLPYPPGAYQAAMQVVFKPAATNTGAATINVNGLGAKPIKRIDGTDVDANDIPAGALVEVRYDGTQFRLTGGSSGASVSAQGYATEAKGYRDTAATHASNAATAATTATDKAAEAAGYAASVNPANFVLKSSFTAANMIAVSTGAGTVVTLAVGASTLVGRDATGGIAALSAATVRTLLSLNNVENKSSATIRGELTGGNVTGALGYTPYNATNPSGFITGNGRAYPRNAAGGDMNFNWSGQAGQPTWLWGGTDGTNFYVYNPSNFSVAYAANAGALSGYGLSVGNAASTVIARDGSGYAYATNWRVESDAELKDEVTRLDGRKALAAVLDIGAHRYFKRCPDDSRPPVLEYGHIAQDVERHYPELVHIGEDGYRRMDPITPLLFAAIEHLVGELRRAGIAVAL